jgi:hypothetical protein
VDANLNYSILFHYQFESLKRPIDIIAIWLIYAFTIACKCEHKCKLAIQGYKAEGVCTQSCLAHTMRINDSNKCTSSYLTKSSKMVDRCYRP